MTITRNRSVRVLLAVALASLLAVTSLATVDASSHREAPLIAEDPVADNTDTYAFVSPANPDNTVLIANYIPLQGPDGGPNFFNFGDDVLYEINVDSDGDAIPDTTFEFDFRTELTDPNSFLYAFGQITSLEGEGAAAWNLRQFYTLSVVRDGVRTVLGENLIVPPNNLGPRTTPNYGALSDAAVQTVNDGSTSLQVFAGQKDDPFWVDLGSIFDLGALRPFESLHLIDQPDTDPIDTVAGKNVHSIAVEVPSAYLGATDEQPVIGVWATASRRQVRTFAGGSSANPIYSGPYRQVSRLGMPLVNEVVIPLGLKDAFNTLQPSQDVAVLGGVEAERLSGANSTEGIAPIVTDPELADLLPVLYPDAFAGDNAPFSVPPAPRDDILAVFLTGVAPGGTNLNQFPEGFLPSEMIRLNTSIAPSSSDPNDVNRLGVLGEDNTLTGELDGFPNGRRLADDTVDISLRVVAGALVDPTTTPPLTDGVLGNDVPFLTTFPYLAHAHSGYYSPEENPTSNNL